MNNYELEKNQSYLQSYAFQSTYLKKEWFAWTILKRSFEILNNNGKCLDGLMELFAKCSSRIEG